MNDLDARPLYRRIYIHLYNDISSGIFKIGDAIPTENQIMGRYKASRTTVRHAISILQKEKLIIRKPGSGSFVAKTPLKRSISLQGSFNDILSVAKSTSVNVLRFEYMDATPDIAKLLSLKKNKRILRIDRLRFASNTPFLYSKNFLPEDVGLYLSKKDIEEKPLIELLADKCRLLPQKAIQYFNAAIAADQMAEQLKVPIGFPLLEIKRTTYSSESKPINLFFGYFRSDLYVFAAEFTFK